MPYRSAHAPRLADLLLRQGDIAAERAMRAGQVWGDVVRGVASIPAGMQQRRMAEEDRALDRRAREAQIAASEATTRNAQDAMDQRGYDRMDAEAAKDLAKTTDALTKFYMAVESESDPVARRALWSEGRQRLMAEGRYLSQAELPEQYPGTPVLKSYLTTFLLPAAERFKQMFPEPRAPIQHDPTRDLLDPDTYEVIRPGQPRAETPPAVGSYEDYVLRMYGPNPTPAQIRQARRDYPALDSADSSGGPRDNPEFPRAFEQELYDLRARGYSRARAEAELEARQPELRQRYPYLSPLAVQRAMDGFWPIDPTTGLERRPPRQGVRTMTGTASGEMLSEPITAMPGDINISPGAPPVDRVPPPADPVARGVPDAGEQRTATTADVRAVAREMGISESAARRRLEAQGIAIVD